MPKIRGAEAHLARMEALRSPEAIRRIGTALFAAGQEIEADARISITNGAVSGKNHVPSKPGSPPKNDTGHLANNIETIQDQSNPLHVQVASNAQYSQALEFGTSKMLERPFMRPAAARHRGNAAKAVRDAVKSIIRQNAIASRRS